MSENDSIKKLLDDATVAAQNQQLEVAAQALDQVLDQEEDNLRALDLYGFVRFFQGRFAEGEAFCRRAIEASPQHAYAHKGLGLNLAKQGKLDEGVEWLQKAIALKPEWVDPYWDLSVVLYEAKQYDQAQQILARAQVAIPQQRQRFLSFSAKIELEKKQA